MAWFRPARNRNHPGDAPPKWAPMGRFGRAAILLTVVAGVVIALLVIGTRPADAFDAAPDAPPEVSPAPSLQPPPWFGGRAEMPEPGFAVTVPATWVAFDVAGDLDGQVTTARAIDDRLDAEGAAVILQDLRWARERGTQLMMWDIALGDTCAFSIGSVGEVAIEEIVRLIHSHALEREASVEEPRRLDLPYGAGWMIVSRERLAEDPGQSGWVGGYLVEKDERRLMLECVAEDLPADRWRSIVETFEFLPAEE